MKKLGLLSRACAGLSATIFLFVTTVAVYAAAPGWPRQIDADGAQIIVYQPQPESLNGDLLSARAAVSVLLDGQDNAVFGTVWFEAHLTTDRDARTVTVTDIDVPKMKFPHATPEQEQKLTAILKNSITQSEITMSLDRLMSSLDTAKKQEAAAAQLKNDPPQIIFVKTPTALVSIDGDPKLQPVSGSKMMRIMNTPFTIILDPAVKKYYLKGGDNWYAASDVKGPWALEANTPQAVIDAAPASTQPVTAEQLAAETPQNIIVTTVPTELIISDGEPQYTPIDTTNLLYMSNTKSDVFMDINSQNYFLLLSGRWYTSSSLTGPWTFVPANGLPADFANIPEGSAKSGVLSFVAGTTQANEAVLDANIPQTATVKRTAGKDLKVTYDGAPKFKDVEGVKASYAVNSPNAVLKIDGRYYCCDKAVWYEASDPMGPWTVCVKVPNEVYQLPPSCPIYNVKYVYVYDSTPDVVYVGYLPGYVGSYVSGGTVVYGTGYVYQPWCQTIYVPYPVTYGYSAAYDPVSCLWGFGLGFGAGFALGAWCGGAWGGWGPGGWNGNYNKNVTNNIYNHSNNNNGNNYNNRHDHNHGGGGHGGHGGGGQGGHGGGGQGGGGGDQGRRGDWGNRHAGDMRNNVFADRDGNVFRRDNNGWQRFDNNGWSQHMRDADGAQRGGWDRSGFDNMQRDWGNRDRGEFRSDRFDNFSRGGFDRGGFDRGGFGGFRGGGFGGFHGRR